MTQDVIRLRTSDLVNNLYLQHWLNSSLGKYIVEGITVEGTRKRFSLKEFKKIEIPVPPLPLQNQFAERVKAIEQQKQQAEESLRKSEALFNSLLQSAFKGELVG